MDEKSANGERIFLQDLKWIEADGILPSAVPGRSPFLYGSSPAEHLLRIQSLDFEVSEHKPDGISFDASDLKGVPQRPFYHSIRLIGSLNRSLARWPVFCIQQSLAHGEPTGFPGFTQLKPWSDDRIGWFRIFQGGKQLTVDDQPMEGPIEVQCCCVGLLDDPSQGGLKGRYSIEIKIYVEPDKQSTLVTSLKVVIWTKPPAAEWPPESFSP